ncbi:hypothetical protein CDD81_4311 [Ophiocordyceps australis]|uniref:Uncharacterized protein n=1 Tax=Ophiocordyceps australis TaxID=1399860 RepID=A0A2C5YB98_9HYPO|nr:hypothetical protein CDD81_4311 [Ophiocordyceps australis]
MPHGESSLKRPSAEPSKPFKRPKTEKRFRPDAKLTTSTSPSHSPCHICHRRPNNKASLDAFADCQGCGQRTCFVCVRECHGWAVPDEDEAAAAEEEEEQEQEKEKPWLRGPEAVCLDAGHRAVVCSRCCVEMGSQGDVMCLGCLCSAPGS